MPIDRGPFNALVDDDGSGTVGTIWQKASIQGVLLDPIDAALYGTRIDSLTTGIGDAWGPGVVGHATFIRWLGGSDLVVNGLLGGVQAGQRVTLQHLGSPTSVLYVSHQGGSAALGTRLFNFVTSGRTPIGFRGAATYVYDGQNWVLIAHEQGAWLNVPFLASNFTATPGAWTVSSGNVGLNKYRVSGRQLLWQLQVLGTSVSGSPSRLTIAWPNGYQVAGELFWAGGATLSDGVVQQLGMCCIFASAPGLQVLFPDGHAFPTGTGHMSATATVELT